MLARKPQSPRRIAGAAAPGRRSPRDSGAGQSKDPLLRAPTDVDPARVRADFKNGVLIVVVPKAPVTTPKQIEIPIA